MTLSLFIDSLTEYRVRETLGQRIATVPGKVRKSTRKSTLKWVFFLFPGMLVIDIPWVGSNRTIPGRKRS